LIIVPFYLLAEGAPELRRKKQIISSSEDSDEIKQSGEKSEVTRALSTSTSTLEKSASRDESKTHGEEKPDEGYSDMVWKKTSIKTEDDSDSEVDSTYPYSKHGNGELNDGPIMIRPVAGLMPRRAPVEPFPLDKLSTEDRDMYLRDFLPPCPPIRKRQKRHQCLPKSHYQQQQKGQDHLSSHEETESSSNSAEPSISWPIFGM